MRANLSIPVLIPLVGMPAISDRMTTQNDHKNGTHRFFGAVLGLDLIYSVLVQIHTTHMLLFAYSFND